MLSADLYINSLIVSWRASLPRVTSPSVGTAIPSFLSLAQQPPLVNSSELNDDSSGFSLEEKDLQYETGSIRSEIAKLREMKQQIPTLEGMSDLLLLLITI